MLYPLSYRRPSSGVPDDWTRIADRTGQAESASGGGAGSRSEGRAPHTERSLRESPVGRPAPTVLHRRDEFTTTG
jgi:hypothetical protein